MIESQVPRHDRRVSLDRGWPLLFRDLGVEPASVLRKAGLPQDLLRDESSRLGVADYFRLWEALEAEAGDPALPIRLGLAASTESFHPSLFAALCSPNLAVAVRRIARYKRLLAPVQVDVSETEAGLVIQKRWDEPFDQIPTSLAHTELVYLTQIARIGTRSRIVPHTVESRQPMKPARAYLEFFGVRPTVGSVDGVTFDPEDAHRPFLTASDSLWRTFEPELQRQTSQLTASSTLTEQVRSVLLETLPSGETSVADTSRRLGVSARTLQRQLRHEGTSYTEVVRGVRERLARHYVARTDLAYVEIGFLLGYDEPTSFFRAFRQWTGITPAAARQESAP